MTRPATADLNVSPGDYSRRGMAFVMLFALFFQGLVLNTHIHGTPLLYGISQITAADDDPVRGMGAPSEEQDSCPTCHQIAQFGQFVTPSASVLFAPSVAISIIILVFAAPVFAAVPAFSWQGRAPPR